MSFLKRPDTCHTKMDCHMPYQSNPVSDVILISNCYSELVLWLLDWGNSWEKQPLSESDLFTFTPLTTKHLPAQAFSSHIDVTFNCYPHNTDNPWLLFCIIHKSPRPRYQALEEHRHSVRALFWNVTSEAIGHVLSNPACFSRLFLFQLLDKNTDLNPTSNTYVAIMQIEEIPNTNIYFFNDQSEV